MIVTDDLPITYGDSTIQPGSALAGGMDYGLID